MTGANACICRGKPLNQLMAAWATRTKATIADGVVGGRAVTFKDLTLTAILVRKLSEGTNMPFDARYRQHDHHLATCPCSPRYAVAAV